jgi:hypothetical protein
MSRSPLWVSICIFGVVLLATLPPTVFGQQVFGSIYGTVSDPSGSTVPNARVTVTDQEKGTTFQVTTNESGNYSKDRLIPGVYTVEIEVSGFRKAVSKDVRVNVDLGSRLDVTLEVGNVAEQVEITAAAPLLQSDRADVSTTLTGNQLRELPNFDRNVQSYLLLTPGTRIMNGWDHAASENPQGSKQIFVNGQHFSGTGYQLAGTENQDPILGIIVINPNIDSVTETKIASQNYDAEFGYAGAGLMNTSTRSGTNELHGTAFEYLRTNSSGFSDFARNPFSEPDGAPAVHWNQFGGSVGGPLVKNKVFWFGDAQLTRRRTGSSVLTTVPTVRARSGDLSEYVEGSGTAARNVVYDPATGDQNTGVGRTAFPGNVIPANRLSPQALRILSLIPASNAVDPNGSRWRNNYIGTGSNTFDANTWDTRWDWFANDRNSMFGRYSYQEFNQIAPAAFGQQAGGPALAGNRFSGTSEARNQSLAIGFTHMFGPTLINDFRFGYMRYRVNVLPGDIGATTATDAGIPNLNLDPFFTSGIPYFRLGKENTDQEMLFGYSLHANGCNCPLAQKEQQYQWTDNVSKVLGNHMLKFGADMRWALNLRVPSDAHRSGELIFDPEYTGRVDEVNASPQLGLGLATFLLGQVTHFERYVSVSTDASERQKRFFWYGQDTWRVTPKLQLNYGLRWEMVFPETVNAPGNGAQLNLATGKIGVFGIGNVSMHGYQEMNWKNFAPRLGITYQLTPSTVVRAGYGWAYELGTFGSIFGHNVTQNLPVLARQAVDRTDAFKGVFTLAQGPPPLVTPQPDQNGEFQLPSGIAGKARPQNLVMPRIMTYNFTVQHSLAKDLALSVAYVGNQGRHVFVGNGPDFDVNAAALGPGPQSARRPFFSRYGWANDIRLYCNCANNRYDSMQVSVDKRYSGGFTLLFNYTLQMAQGDGQVPDGVDYAFLYDRTLGYGEHASVPRHQFNGAFNWEIPFGRGRRYGRNMSRALDLGLGGWNIDGVTTYYSGLGFTPSFDAPPGAIRPDVGPNNVPDQGNVDPFEGARKNRTQWFVPGLGGAFLLPANNAFGRYPINTLRGPEFLNQDLALAKRFAIAERVRFTLRGEAYNLFNHTNLGLPERNVTAGTAGQITSIAFGSQMRRLQYAFRIDF